MVNVERDNEGKTRIAKGDKTGLGGQYAPDVDKLNEAKNKLESFNDSLTEPVKEITFVTDLTDLWREAHGEWGVNTLVGYMFAKLDQKDVNYLADLARSEIAKRKNWS